MDFLSDEFIQYELKKEKELQIKQDEMYRLGQVLESLFNTEEVKEVRRRLEEAYLSSTDAYDKPLDCYKANWFKRGFSRFFFEVDNLIQYKRQRDVNPED